MNIQAFKNTTLLSNRVDSSNPHAETLTFNVKETYGTKRLYPANPSTERWIQLLGNKNKSIDINRYKKLILSDNFNIELYSTLT
tara:strand:+ start:316 stop:567 length:252 start_codon:yes stop_codon:yes gene_type:complete